MAKLGIHAKNFCVWRNRAQSFIIYYYACQATPMRWLIDWRIDWTIPRYGYAYSPIQRIYLSLSHVKDENDDDDDCCRIAA